jgi:formate dehydrogenase subunit gamma
MTKSKVGSNNGAKRVRSMLLGMVLVAATAMLLPLTGHVWSTANAQEQATQGAMEGAERTDTDTNPRADYWREVRGGEPGYTAITGPETDILIQSRGESWRELRNGPVAKIGAAVIIVTLLALAAYQLFVGGAKLEHRTGRKVLRWAFSDRVLHWYTAILFIIQAITGLSLLWGRSVLIPVLGKEGFAAWAGVAKPVHDYLALFFTAGLAVMLLKWVKHNIPRSYDVEWFMKLGGYFGGGHPRAGFANAGEKAYFWLLAVAGTALVASGFYLLFPNFGFERAAMQNANIIHNVSALILIAMVFAHIYLGTLGSEGALEGMLSGEVDEGWARQHHNVWLEELETGGDARSSEAKASGRSATAST